jgi:hypothetical protein
MVADDHRAIRDRLLKVLEKEQALREKRPYPKWHQAELKAMCCAVNRIRKQTGCAAPVVMADIERVETMASGHTDYSTKFALYCAELAMGVERPEP